MPGRLQDAINHFNGCVMANESHARVREAALGGLAAFAEAVSDPDAVWEDGNARALLVLAAHEGAAAQPEAESMQVESSQESSQEQGDGADEADEASKAREEEEEQQEEEEEEDEE